MTGVLHSLHSLHSLQLSVGGSDGLGVVICVDLWEELVEEEVEEKREVEEQQEEW